MSLITQEAVQNTSREVMQILAKPRRPHKGNDRAQGSSSLSTTHETNEVNCGMLFGPKGR